MVKTLRAGVVGAGVFGGHHARKYASIEGVVVTSVFDIDPVRGESLAARFGADAAPSLEALLDQVDVVTVAAPAGHHYQIGRRALEAGVHVYMEKPLALDLEQADELVALAAERDLTLYVGHQERVVVEAIGLFDRSESPSRIEFARLGPSSGRCEDVSVVWDLMVHDLDLATALTGSRPMDVAAAGTDHETAATVAFHGGTTATLLASRRSPELRRTMTAHYADGSLTVDFVARVLTSNRAGRAERLEFGDIVCDPLGAHVGAFIDAVRGERDSGVLAVDARRSVELASMVEMARARTNVGFVDRVDAVGGSVDIAAFLAGSAGSADAVLARRSRRRSA